MHIVVSELPIEDAVGRARTRFQRADERLSLALAGSASGLPWVALGVLAVFAGALALTGIVPLPADAALVIGVVTLILGGIFLGYGLPLWSLARKEKKRRSREWQHALEMLRLRERQAEENPELTVEVLDRVDGRHPLLISKWSKRTSAITRYLQ
jgi:Flp pilus assembly protein TadB